MYVDMAGLLTVAARPMRSPLLQRRYPSAAAVPPPAPTQSCAVVWARRRPEPLVYSAGGSSATLSGVPASSAVRRVIIRHGDACRAAREVSNAPNGGGSEPTLSQSTTLVMSILSTPC